jgi:hypothetical protein
MAGRAGYDRETSAATLTLPDTLSFFTERDGYSQVASLVGGRGLGIEIRHDSGHRILNTTIAGITQLDPFSGNAVAARRRHRAPHREGEWDRKSLGANAAIDGLRQR